MGRLIAFRGTKEIGTADAAAMLGVSSGKVRELIYQGDLYAWRLSDRGVFRVQRESVQELLRDRAGTSVLFGSYPRPRRSGNPVENSKIGDWELTYRK